jgi:hypothetical protein
MWILVYVLLVNQTPFARAMSIHDTMSECFQARDVLALQQGREDGHFPKGSQAVCIRN